MTRTVELTDHSVVIDGRDVSSLVTGTQLTITRQAPILDLQLVPDAVLYSGSAEVSGVPLDGIERLRRRLGRP